MEGDNPDVIYLDFSKAFDTVFHYCLLVKMKSFDISKNIISIVRYFLTDRTMKVKIGNNYSETQNIPSDVLQESVLRPLFFVVGDSPMTRIMDLPKGYINQELSW